MSDGTETYAAGRVGDPIAHSHALGGFIAGALVGVAAAVGVAVGAAMVAGAIAAEVVTAGLATPLVAGAAVVVGELAVNIFLGGWLAEKAQQIGESIGAGSHGAPSGQITVGDPGIIINDKPAVVVDSRTSCDNSTVAQGSSTVFFNGKPAARIGDKTSCGGIIISGSGDVLIGSPPVTVGSIADEVPNWVRWAAVILPLLPGIGQALRTVGKGLLTIEAQGFGRALRIGAKTVARNLEERAAPGLHNRSWSEIKADPQEFKPERPEGAVAEDPKARSLADQQATDILTEQGREKDRGLEVLNSGRDFQPVELKEGDPLYGFISEGGTKSAYSPYWLDQNGFNDAQSKFYDSGSGTWDRQGLKDYLALPCANQANNIVSTNVTADHTGLASTVNTATENITYVTSDGTAIPGYGIMPGGGAQTTPAIGKIGAISPFGFP